MQSRIFFVGDSTTNAGFNSWPATLVSTITGIGPIVWSGTNTGISAATVHFIKLNIDSLIAAQKDNHVVGYVVLGVNDFGTGVLEADWKSDLTYILDALKARWPQLHAYVGYPWKRGYDSAATTFHGWIDDVLATRSTFASAGDDEVVWFKPPCDTEPLPCTLSTDGVHYDLAAGQTEAVTQRKAILGY